MWRMAVREVVAVCGGSLAPHLDAWPSQIFCRFLSVIRQRACKTLQDYSGPRRRDGLALSKSPTPSPRMLPIAACFRPSPNAWPSEDDLHFLAVIRASSDRDLFGSCWAGSPPRPTGRLWQFVALLWAVAVREVVRFCEDGLAWETCQTLHLFRPSISDPRRTMPDAYGAESGHCEMGNPTEARKADLALWRVLMAPTSPDASGAVLG
jgi:hypothetical protein